MLQLPTAKRRHPPGEMKSGPLKGIPKACSGTCEVLALAMQYEKLVVIHTEADDRNASKAGDAAWRRMAGISEKASWMTPRSFEGAAFQIMLAASMLNGIRNGVTETTRVEDENRAERLLYRAMDRIGDINGPGWGVLRGWLMHADQKKPQRARRAR